MRESLLGCALVLALPLAASAVVIDLVTIGDQGNAADPLNASTVPGIGSVDYVYAMGKYEISNAEYVDFLNAVAASDPYQIYKSATAVDPRGGIVRSGNSGSYAYSIKPDMADKPATFVGFYDAIRFVNWLENGQPTGSQGPGTTETGSYTLYTDGSSTTNVSARSADAVWVLPNENEWYKAAYYDPGPDGSADDYWLYPTRSDSTPTLALADATGNITNAGPNVVNYNQGADWNGRDGNVTSVGGAGSSSASYYGTYDQAGNAWEWIDGMVGTNRMTRGGFWGFFPISSSVRASSYGAGNSSGFRVAAIPEPGTFVLLALAALTAGVVRQRGRR